MPVPRSTRPHTQRAICCRAAHLLLFLWSVLLLLLLGSNHLAPLHRVISSDARLRAAFADADVELPSLGRLSVRGGTLSLPIEPRSGPASFPSVGPLLTLLATRSGGSQGLSLSALAVRRSVPPWPRHPWISMHSGLSVSDVDVLGSLPVHTPGACASQKALGIGRPDRAM